MKNKILWVEDESYMIQGLFKPLLKMNINIVVAKCAIEAYHMSMDWKSYDMIIVDLIIPLRDDEELMPNIVKDWEIEPYIGIGLAKWLSTELKVECPILLLSVIDNPIKSFELSKFGLKYYLSKSGLLPSRVKEEILSILESKNE
jgi:DNA-binding NarL/FixJ family response regulator